jgi:hypothetical protein
MSLYNFAALSTPIQLAAAASNASTLTGAAVDLIEYDLPIVITQNHGVSTGTLDGKIQDSDDGTTGWADVAGAVFTQSTTTADIKSMMLNAGNCRRFIRYVGTIVTGPQVFSVHANGVKKIA